MITDVQPQDVSAERAILGTLVTSGVGDGSDIIYTRLEATDFYLRGHRAIFLACEGLYRDGLPLDLVSVVDRLEKIGKLEDAGGAPGVSEIAGEFVPNGYVEYYCGLIKDKSVLRMLVEHGRSIAARASAPDAVADEVVDWAQASVYSVGEARSVDSYITIGEILSVVAGDLQRSVDGGLAGEPTGFSGLDKVTAGLHKTDLTILAARPGCGKTTLAVNVATNLCRRGKNVLLFSLEMSRGQLVTRMLCSRAGVSMHLVRLGQIQKRHLGELEAAAEEMFSTPMCIYDSFNLSPVQVMAQGRKFKKEYGALDLVVIDYLQLMQPSRRQERREREISSISRELKGAAKALDVPVLALSQMNRAVEQGVTTREPRLSDLRESGSIEQDSDNVWFLHREKMYEVDDVSVPVDVIVAKNRNGPCGKIPLQLDPRHMKFCDRADEYGEQEEVDAWGDGNYR